MICDKDDTVLKVYDPNKFWINIITKEISPTYINNPSSIDISNTLTVIDSETQTDLEIVLKDIQELSLSKKYIILLYISLELCGKMVDCDIYKVKKETENLLIKYSILYINNNNNKNNVYLTNFIDLLETSSKEKNISVFALYGKYTSISLRSTCKVVSDEVLLFGPFIWSSICLSGIDNCINNNNNISLSNIKKYGSSIATLHKDISSIDDDTIYTLVEIENINIFPLLVQKLFPAHFIQARNEFITKNTFLKYFFQFLESIVDDININCQNICPTVEQLLLYISPSSAKNSDIFCTKIMNLCEQKYELIGKDSDDTILSIDNNDISNVNENTYTTFSNENVYDTLNSNIVQPFSTIDYSILSDEYVDTNIIENNEINDTFNYIDNETVQINEISETNDSILKDNEIIDNDSALQDTAETDILEEENNITYTGRRRNKKKKKKKKNKIPRHLYILECYSTTGEIVDKEDADTCMIYVNDEDEHLLPDIFKQEGLKMYTEADYAEEEEKAKLNREILQKMQKKIRGIQFTLSRKPKTIPQRYIFPNMEILHYNDTVNVSSRTFNTLVNAVTGNIRSHHARGNSNNNIPSAFTFISVAFNAYLARMFRRADNTTWPIIDRLNRDERFRLDDWGDWDYSSRPVYLGSNVVLEEEAARNPAIRHPTYNMDVERGYNIDWRATDVLRRNIERRRRLNR